MQYCIVVGNQLIILLFLKDNEQYITLTGLINQQYKTEFQVYAEISFVSF